MNLFDAVDMFIGKHAQPQDRKSCIRFIEDTVHQIAMCRSRAQYPTSKALQQTVRRLESECSKYRRILKTLE